VSGILQADRPRQRLHVIPPIIFFTVIVIVTFTSMMLLACEPLADSWAPCPRQSPSRRAHRRR
jgi:hypothetical protein